MEFALTHPDTGTKEILVIFDGVPYEANSDHPWWDEIVRLCLADDERVLDLFPIRPVQTASKEIPVEEANPPVESLLRVRPENFVLVEAFKDNGYTLIGVAETTGYTLEEIHGWMNEDPSLYQELRAAIEVERNRKALRERAYAARATLDLAGESRWLPTNVEPAEDEHDEVAPLTLADEDWPTGVI